MALPGPDPKLTDANGSFGAGLWGHWLAELGQVPFVPQEEDEAVFHEDWQRRIFALNMASLAFLGPVDRARHAIERMNSFEYLATSYYEHWTTAILTMAKDLGYVTD